MSFQHLFWLFELFQWIFPAGKILNEIISHISKRNNFSFGYIKFTISYFSTINNIHKILSSNLPFIQHYFSSLQNVTPSFLQLPVILKGQYILKACIIQFIILSALMLAHKNNTPHPHTHILYVYSLNIFFK